MFSVFYRTVQGLLRPIHSTSILLLIKNNHLGIHFPGSSPASQGEYFEASSDHRIKSLDWEALEFLKSWAFERFIVMESPFERDHFILLLNIYRTNIALSEKKFWVMESKCM